MLDPFSDIDEETLNNKYLEASISVARWIKEENSGKKTDRGIFFYYANFLPLKFHILNPSAKASAFFAKLFLITGNKKYRDLSTNSVDYILNFQNPDGSWFYSERSDVIDSFHTGLILESLLDIYSSNLFDGDHIQRSLKEGFSFYWQYFFLDKQIETYKKQRTLKERIYNFFYPNINSSKLWSYGIAINIFSRAISLLGTEDYTNNILRYLLRLKQPNGAFGHKLSDPRTFIREEAHIFNGLAHYLLVTND